MATNASAAKSLVQTAIDAVNGYIRDKELRVGDTLPGEGYFAERLGVSRAVMREAFQALAALKLIDVANGRKPRVGALDGSVIATSLDVCPGDRLTLLTPAAAASASRADAPYLHVPPPKSSQNKPVSPGIPLTPMRPIWCG